MTPGPLPPCPLAPSAMPCDTLHTYPDLIFDGGRHALTLWHGPATCRQVTLSAIARDPEVIVSRARGTDGIARGLMPGGLGLA